MTYSSELKGTFAFLSIIMACIWIHRHFTYKKMSKQNRLEAIAFRDKYDVIAAPGFDGDKDTFMLQFEVVREGKRNYCRFVSFDPRTFLQLPKTGIL